MRFAVRHPDSIRRLVLVDSIALGAPDLRSTLHLLRAMFSRSEERLYELVAQAVLYEQGPGACRFLASASIPHGVGGFLWMFSRTWSAALPVLNLTLRRITAPTMILWGQDDRYFPLGQAERSVGCIPGAELRVIPCAGHAPFLEQPGLFRDALEDFLSRS